MDKKSGLVSWKLSFMVTFVEAIVYLLGKDRAIHEIILYRTRKVMLPFAIPAWAEIFTGIIIFPLVYILVSFLFDDSEDENRIKKLLLLLASNLFGFVVVRYTLLGEIIALSFFFGILGIFLQFPETLVYLAAFYLSAGFHLNFLGCFFLTIVFLLMISVDFLIDEVVFYYNLKRWSRNPLAFTFHAKNKKRLVREILFISNATRQKNPGKGLCRGFLRNKLAVQATFITGRRTGEGITLKIGERVSKKVLAPWVKKLLKDGDSFDIRKESENGKFYQIRWSRQ